LSFARVIFKKTGITFIVHFVYFIIEPILDFKLNDKLTPFLPINAINNIITSPNTSLIKIKSPDFNYDFQEALILEMLVFALVYRLVHSYYLCNFETKGHLIIFTPG